MTTTTTQQQQQQCTQTLHTIPASVDGFPIKLTIFECTGVEISNTVIISPATGVPAKFYTPFAKWLAQQNCFVITFDYRLCGLSFPPNVDISDEEERVKALIDGKDTSIAEHWGRRDQRAVIQFAHNVSKGREIVLLGHSVGGHIAPLSTMEQNPIIDRYLFISVQAPYWEYYDAPDAQKEIWDTIKISIEKMGYFKCSEVGLGNDIPAKTGMDWYRWCNEPQYIAAEEPKAYEAFQKPLLSIGFADDLLSNLTMFDKYLQTLPQASSTRLWIDPKQMGWGEIGHVNFFKEKNKQAWPLVLDWIKNGKIPIGVGDCWRSGRQAKL